MQQNVTVNNRGCCGGIVAGFALLILVVFVAGAVGRLFDFLFSLPGILLIGLVLIAGAIYYSRRPGR